MKTAVVYDILIARGGGERATLALAKAFNADVWTTTYDPATIYPAYKNIKIVVNPLKSLKLPVRGRILRYIQSALVQTECIYKFRRTDLSSYDLVITVGQCSKHVPTPKSGHRIHYELGIKENYHFEWLFKPWVIYMRKLDFEAIKQINTLACNSQNIRNKIKRYYNREAMVIYPAVNIKMFQTGEPGDYFLAVERISPDKGIETQLEAFRMVPEHKLLIVGSPQAADYSYFEQLKRIAPPNVTFLGLISDEEVIDLYSHAKAAIQTHPDEDLGRIPIEAMASGKPAIAVNAGGFRETILHGKTGILIDPPYIDNLAEAVRQFNSADFNQNDCLERAQMFSEETHIEMMRNIVERMYTG